MPVRLPDNRGFLDRRPTPEWLYGRVVGAGWVDACTGDRDFILNPPPARRLYCNPPFSEKRYFVEAACNHAREGASILMYLPADVTTLWYRRAVVCGAKTILLTRRTMAGGRYPAMLIVFNYDVWALARELGLNPLTTAVVADVAEKPRGDEGWS